MEARVYGQVTARGQRDHIDHMAAATMVEGGITDTPGGSNNNHKCTSAKAATDRCVGSTMRWTGMTDLLP